MKAILTAMTLALMTPPLQAGDGHPLIAERWQGRPLIVIVPDARDETLLRLRRALAEPAIREAFVEREMVLYEVVAGHAVRNGEPLGSKASRALLQAVRYETGAPARVVLVGKDGGIKVDQPGPVDPQELFSTIDRMPMRQGQ